MPKMNRIGTHKTNHLVTNGFITVSYHETGVFELDKLWHKLTLDTGGWFTSTTKVRMNQALNVYGIKASVFQRKGDWFVNVPFRDGSGSIEYQFEGDYITFQLDEENTHIIAVTQ